MKTLIAYYSRKGENYVGGQIINLAEGNTHVVAKKIQALTGGDLFEIDTVTPYPTDYNETTDIAKTELANSARPKIKGNIANMAEYEAIFLGYPNWWGTMPMAGFTFLESYDLSGKLVAPFCTHEGSGMGGEQDIAKLCPNAILLSGLAIRGSMAAESGSNVEEWLKRLGI